MSYFFTIEGDKESGKYVVTESGITEPLFVITGVHYGGLKEARQSIGKHLLSKGYSQNSVFEHYCIKPNRRNNPKLKWTVKEYLVVVPLKK
jgi:hypothetical protein